MVEPPQKTTIIAPAALLAHHARCLMSGECLDPLGVCYVLRLTPTATRQNGDPLQGLGTAQ